MVTPDEVNRYLADFASLPASRTAGAELLKALTPRDVAVTVPAAFFEVTRHVRFPDGEAHVSQLPIPMHRSAEIAIDIATHLDSGEEGSVTRVRASSSSRVGLEEIDAALHPDNLELLRERSDDYGTPPKIVGELNALREHIVSSSTSRETVRKNPHEFTATLPLQGARLELVTFGAEDRVVNNAFVERNRFLSTTLPPGASLIIQATVAGRFGNEVKEDVVTNHGSADKTHDLVVPGIMQGKATDLTVVVVVDNKVVDAVRFQVPDNPITERVTTVMED